MKIKYLFRFFIIISSPVLIFIGALAKLQHYHPWDEILLIGGLLDTVVAGICFFYMTSNNKKLLIKCLFWLCLTNSIVLTFMGALAWSNDYHSSGRNSLLGALLNYAVAGICLVFMLSNKLNHLNKTK
jgi:hypothetical protein